MLARSDYELVVVDSTESLGFSSWINWRPEFKGRVSIVPAFDQDGLDEFFSRVDVLLFPTLCKESFGLIVREALIRDVWVVTTAAGGVVEDIEDGVNGTILPIDLTPDLLRAELERLLENAEDIKKAKKETLEGNWVNCARIRSGWGHHSGFPWCTP